MIRFYVNPGTNDRTKHIVAEIVSSAGFIEVTTIGSAKLLVTADPAGARYYASQRILVILTSDDEAPENEAVRYPSLRRIFEKGDARHNVYHPQVVIRWAAEEVRLNTPK